VQRVTVYIPTRNRSSLLRRAVESALAQSHDDIEIIVVDDASEDDTPQVMRELMAANNTAKTLSFIRLERPSGACAARNAAIEAATGRFITGLDDDDYFLPDRVRRLLDAFEPNRHAFVFCGYIRETVRAGGKASRAAVRLTDQARFPSLLQRNNVGNQVLTLTERFRALGGFDVALPAWQDYDMWIRLVRAYGEGQGIRGVTYVHTVDPGVPGISGSHERVSHAFEVFRSKHREYDDERLLSCLRLSKAYYGINALRSSDLLNILSLGRPRLVASSLYFYLKNKFQSY